MAGISIIVRAARVEDVPTIADFNIRIAAETEDLVLDCATVGAVIEDESKGFYLVAEDEDSGALVGQLMITYEWCDWRNANIWWIQSVYVEPASRRRGAFRALYLHAKNLAKEAETCGLRLYADSNNFSAHETYKKLGMNSHYIVFEDMWPTGT